MRALRSLLIGDCDHYVSPYIRGVAQAMRILGHHHAEISIRQPMITLQKLIAKAQPEIIWTHMLLWPPPGSPTAGQLEGLVHHAAKLGSKVVLHDGDCKEQPRYPQDISAWCSVALCNHAFDRSAWRCPILYWPYFAFAQEGILPPTEKHLHGKLFFAGTMQYGALYDARNRLLDELKQKGVPLWTPHAGNTLFQTGHIAPSATAVLGFGRPDQPGWVDTRVFQYPGAGGILIHDHAPQLTPWEHFVPYASGSADSVAEAFAKVRAMPEAEQRAMRERAHHFVQERHSSVARVREVLDFLFPNG